ncbi:hypothetical protein L6452_35688 [Arctium lappa]|uniref:Uncharacterized protein n=1 Tax=Arctium lappa TaxID=4217 RepID=A0ACB8Y7S5_ARCLA|nr:hypothetical protein L6452_35688 [Arctium lappa]
MARCPDGVTPALNQKSKTLSIFHFPISISQFPREHGERRLFLIILASFCESKVSSTVAPPSLVSTPPYYIVFRSQSQSSRSPYKPLILFLVGLQRN